MNRIWIVTFLLAFVAGHGFAESAVGYKVFQDGDFSLECPDWRIQKPGSSRQILRVKNGCCTVLVDVHDASIDSVYDGTLAAVKDKDLIEADRENHVLEYQQRFLLLKLCVKKRFVSANHKTYVVSFVTRKGQYDEKMHIADHVLNSVKTSGEASSPTMGKGHHKGFRKDEFRYGIYGIKVDGSGLERLYASHLPMRAAEVSPDGKKIAFCQYTRDTDGDGRISHRDQDASEIAVVNVDGTGLRYLTNNDSWDIQPNWTTDGRGIVFVSDRHSSSKFDLDVFVMDLDTGKVRNITNTPDLIDGDPDAHAGQVVFNRFDKDRLSQSIWIMKEDGSDQRRISHSKKAGKSKSGYRFGDFDPSLSADGKKVTFVRLEDDVFKVHDRVVGNYDLYVMDADGSNLRNISNTPYVEGVPEWSPRGDYVSYVVIGERPEDRYRIYIADPDGRNRRKIIQGAPRDFLAHGCAWFPAVAGEHPDIVFVGEWWE